MWRNRKKLFMDSRQRSANWRDLRPMHKGLSICAVKIVALPKNKRRISQLQTVWRISVRTLLAVTSGWVGL